MAETFATDEGATTAAALVADALKWHTDRPTVPELCGIVSTNELELTYRANRSGGHYFDPETLRCFGVRSFTLAAPGVAVECQSKAPEGVGRYRVTAWTWEDRDGVRELHPQNVARCYTRADAMRLARAIPAAWEAYAAAYAHAYHAGHRAGARTLADSTREAAAMLDSLTAARDALAAALDGSGVTA
jgi:hypothetical protein